MAVLALSSSAASQVDLVIFLGSSANLRLRRLRLRKRILLVPLPTAMQTG